MPEVAERSWLLIPHVHSICGSVKTGKFAPLRWIQVLQPRHLHALIPSQFLSASIYSLSCTLTNPTGAATYAQSMSEHGFTGRLSLRPTFPIVERGCVSMVLIISRRSG